MNTESALKEWLDGWFFSIDHERGTVVSTAVPFDHIPDHKPKMLDIDEDAVRVNGNAHDWDDEQDDYIIERRTAGDTFAKIGSDMGMSQSAIQKRYIIVCTQRGLKKMPRCAGRPRKHPIEVEEAIVRHRQDGMNFTDIAALVNLTRSKVYEIYRTYRQRCDKRISLIRTAA